jgi:uncharacterized CHY-type Zn-finger protein
MICDKCFDVLEDRVQFWHVDKFTLPDGTVQYRILCGKCWRNLQLVRQLRASNRDRPLNEPIVSHRHDYYRNVLIESFDDYYPEE